MSQNAYPGRGSSGEEVLVPSEGERAAEPASEPAVSGQDAPAEAGAAASGESAVPASAEVLRENERLREQMLRVQAEMDNLRKRTAREMETARAFANEKLLAELLPVLDSMELGIEAADKEGVDVASLREGVELTHRKLVGVLEKFGVSVIDPLGASFDAETQHALTMQEGQPEQSGKVLAVVQKGYLLNGRLLRAASVIVAK